MLLFLVEQAKKIKIDKRSKDPDKFSKKITQNSKITTQILTAPNFCEEFAFQILESIKKI